MSYKIDTCCNLAWCSALLGYGKHRLAEQQDFFCLMNLFTLLITDKCVNTCFHCWAASVQFDSNLLNFVLVIHFLLLFLLYHVQLFVICKPLKLYLSLFYARPLKHLFFLGSIIFSSFLSTAMFSAFRVETGSLFQVSALMLATL